MWERRIQEDVGIDCVRHRLLTGDPRYWNLKQLSCTMAGGWGGRVSGLLLVFSVLGSVGASISDLRLCADPECKERISKAITVIGYPSKDEYILSFPVNTEVTVYSKEAGTNKDLWGVEIKGKRGYVPKRYLRETKVFVKKLEYEVPTELGANVPDPQDNKQVEEPKSDNLNLQHEVEQQNDEQVADQVAASAEDIEFQRVTKGLSQEDKQKEEIPDEVVGKEEKNVEEAQSSSEKLEQGEEDKDITKDDSPTGEPAPEDGEGKGSESEEVEEVKVNEQTGDDNEGSEEVKDRSIDDSTSVEEDQKAVDLEVKSESVESTDERIDSENASLQNESQEQAESETVSDGEPNPLETSSQNGDMPSPTPTPSSPDYEVIDGTTIYFDDPPPVEVPSVIVESSIHLDSSSVVNEEYSSVQTPPIVTDTFTVTDVNAIDVTEPTVTQSLDNAASDESELESETVVRDLNPEPTESVTQLFTDQSDIILDDSKPDIDPTSSSWIAQAATSVTSWFGESGEVQENSDLESTKSEDNDGDAQLPLPDSNEKDSKDEDKSDFMVPKPESIIEEVVTQEPEAEEESTGFFSSWFGSSEDTNESDNPSTESDFVESDRDSQDNSDVKLNVVSEEGSPVESEQTADPTVSSVPSDAENTLVDQYEPPASDVDDTAYKPHAVQDGPPTVESSPDATVVPNPQAFTDDLTSTDDTLTPSDAYDNAEEDSDQSSENVNVSASDSSSNSAGVTGESVTNTDLNNQPTVDTEATSVESPLWYGPPTVESSPDATVVPNPQAFTDDLTSTDDTLTPSDAYDNAEEDSDQSSENVNVSASDSSSNSAGVTGESVTNTDLNNQPTVDTEAQSVESPLLVSSDVEDSPSRVEDSPSELDDEQEELGPSTARPLFAEPTPSLDPENLAHLAGLVSNDTDHLICAHFRTDDSFLKLLTNSIIGHNTRKRNVHGAIKLIEKLFTDVGQEDVTPEYFEEKLELLAQRDSVPSKTSLDPNCYDEVPEAKGTNNNGIQNREEDVLTVDLPNSLYKVADEEKPESFLRQLSLSDQSDIFGESQGFVSNFNSLEKKNEMNNVEYQDDKSDTIEMPKIQDQLLLTSSDDKDSNFLSKSLDNEMDLISSKSSVEPGNSILNETITSFGNVIEHNSDVIPLESEEVTADYESHDEVSNSMIVENFDTHIHLVHEEDTQSSKVFGDEVLLHQDVIRDVYTLSSREIVKSDVLNDAVASVSKINVVDTITAEGTIEADGAFTVGTVGEEVDIFSTIGLDEMIHEVHTHVAETTDEIYIVSPEFVVEEVDIVSPESVVEEVGIVSWETVVEEIA
ncbi:uncharacterized protein LOC134787484, partial [Penaeus indicus]|uniref:uncharacterized protein LOC134787484 n=1 Tax=Penaeus indicus TaxID=29960 RepID=UPI00300D8C13